MTKAKEHIDAMHARLKTIASQEQSLVDALSEALMRADQKLLDDVRSITFEHEARRAAILSELHGLAARIGAFPKSEEPLLVVGDDAAELPYYEPAATREVPGSLDAEPVAAGGDWRKAAEKIREEFEYRISRQRLAS
jgi:hypothetical protein